MIRSLLVIGLLVTGATEASARSIVGKWDCEAREGRGMACGCCWSTAKAVSFTISPI